MVICNLSSEVTRTGNALSPKCWESVRETVLARDDRYDGSSIH